MIGALVGYIAAETLLTPFMHPLHWLSAILVASTTYIGVLLGYRWHYPQQRRIPQIGRKAVVDCDYDVLLARRMVYYD